MDRARRISPERKITMLNLGLLSRLKVFHSAHVDNEEAALAMAREALAMFEGKHPLYYLDAIAALAWIERRMFGQVSSEVQRSLEHFERHEATGKLMMLRAQGFI